MEDTGLPFIASSNEGFGPTGDGSGIFKLN